MGGPYGEGLKLGEIIIIEREGAETKEIVQILDCKW